MTKKVIIVGGGIAGMHCAISLTERGAKTTIIEKSDRLGGKLNSWHKLFPTFTPVAEVLDPILSRIKELEIEVIFNSEVNSLEPNSVTLSDGVILKADAIVVCSGFKLFNAELKEEYGYKIYDNVITSVDLEEMFNSGSVMCSNGDAPKRIALLHCVGSRDEKVCQPHCSRVCCVTGVKQAIELKKLHPNSEIFNFYMDIRMFGTGYEELYKEAQIDYNIHFVRGRISESAQTIDNKIQIKSEDTLIGKPLKMTVDLLVLLVGMSAGESNASFAKTKGVEQRSCGFIAPKNIFNDSVMSTVDSIFYAGTVTGAKSIGESITEGIAVSHRVAQYLKI